MPTRAILAVKMRIGPIWISAYTLWLWCGIALAFCWLAWAAPKMGLNYSDWIQWAIASLGAALCLGRLGYIVLHGAYFVQNPESVWRLVRVPGIHGTGAMAGALIVTLAGAHRKQVPARAALALVGPGCLLVALGAWLGCWSAGCAWGREVSRAALPVWMRWSVASLRDLYHMRSARIAVQGLGAGLALALILVAGVWPFSRPWVLPLYLAGQAGLALLRADPVTMVAGVRLDLLLDIGLAAVWIAAAVLPRRRPSQVISS